MSAVTKTERVLRDVLNSDNLRDFLGGDVVNNAMKWRFLQAALYVLDGHGLLGDPADAVKEVTPAPPDPSKVTVEITDWDGFRPGDVVVQTPEADGVEGAAFLVERDQPAPEPEPEWKPGTVGTAGTVRGLTYTGPVVRTDEHLLPWWTPSRVDGAHYHGEETVTDFVPDEPRPLPTEAELTEAMYGVVTNLRATAADYAAAVHAHLVRNASLRGESR